MPRLIIRIAVYLLGEKKVASYIAERYGTQGFDDVSRSVGRLCSALNVPYTPNDRITPERYAHEIRQNVDVCVAMVLYKYDASWALGNQWTEEERAKMNETASLRDPFKHGPHSCYNRIHDGKETDKS